MNLENIQVLWPQVSELIKPALKIIGTHSDDDVRVGLLTQKATLWVQWENEKVEAAFITEFIPYPQKLTLRLWLAGAVKGAKVKYAEVRKILGEWAKAHGCKEWEVFEGRYGWMRLFPELKFSGVWLRADL
ncbi:MAG TPA: hypothetical protein VJQ82_16490 [Terriglobales bacterium]|nr:hypothetical protein [Terriglobales bacterium]